MNCGTGAMGPFNHANATIGRAYGLLSMNGQGGSVPGETFAGSLGNAYTYSNITFAENEQRSPWEPLHVSKGFKPEDSTVSIFWGARSTTFNLGLREKHWREHVRDMLKGTDQLAAPCLLLDPITARQLSADSSVSSSWPRRAFSSSRISSKTSWSTPSTTSEYIWMKRR